MDFIRVCRKWGLAQDGRRNSMRTVLMGSILLAALSFSQRAQAAPWCANYGGGGTGGGGGSNCGFYSFDQCMAALWGNGGFCARNPFESSYSGGRDSRRRYRRD
ncbi:MAG: DUF3551 domain-containing protein [Alphaproteobacteria bacterium]|nr:MAG: DUF3551 domain-containing protein [Alphaproteobacteria bacterium]